MQSRALIRTRHHSQSFPQLFSTIHGSSSVLHQLRCTTNQMFQNSASFQRCINTNHTTNHLTSSFQQYLQRSFPPSIVSPAISSLFDSKTPRKSALIPLQQRALIRLAGADTLNFLQGLVTNHVIDQFGAKQENGSTVCLNAAMLNSRGRMLYDVLLTSIKKLRNNVQQQELQQDHKTTTSHQGTKITDQQVILMECDQSVVDALVAHLKRCKIRAKVEITKCDPNKSGVFALVGNGAHELNRAQIADQLSAMDEHSTVGNSSDVHGVRMVSVADPRVPSALGQRVYCFFENEKTKNEWMTQKKDLMTEDDHLYQRIRILCGVSEGSSEMPTDESLPLDNNYDILHGVDWHKGCYVGQELTARSHFTGQVRKRVFPVYVNETDHDTRMQVGDKIDFCSDNNKQAQAPTRPARRERSAGKIISSTPDGKLGLGIVRFETVLARQGQSTTQSLCLNKQPLAIVQPYWMNDRELFQEEEDEDDEDEEFAFEEEEDDDDEEEEGNQQQ